MMPGSEQAYEHGKCSAGDTEDGQRHPGSGSKARACDADRAQKRHQAEPRRLPSTPKTM